MRKIYIFILVWGLLVGGRLFAEAPSILYLSWVHDPTSTMTVRWHTSKKKRGSELFYQKKGEQNWSRQIGSAQFLSDSDVLVHQVELTELEPDTYYHFRIGEGDEKFLFRTMPREDLRAVRFVVAGDAYFYLYLFRKMNEQIVRKDPDFILVGGDIAYAGGHKSFFKGARWQVKRWQTFLKEWRKQMVGTDGRLIPMVIVVGNHDVAGKSRISRKKSNLFYELFPMQQKETAYQVLDFGSYLSLFLLDTGHTHPVKGEQQSWLSDVLAERGKVRWKIAAYHIAAYPSVYSYRGTVPTQIRQYWSPLFEQHHLLAAFEHHNHAYKRTHPIKGEKIDPKGVFYLGDGAWGVSPRKPQPMKKHWYMDNALETNCFWLVSLHQGDCSIESFDIKGKPIDAPLRFIRE